MCVALHRYFLYDHLPQLRFNNPDVWYAAHEAQPECKVRVYLKSAVDEMAADEESDSLVRPKNEEMFTEWSGKLFAKPGEGK